MSDTERLTWLQNNYELIERMGGKWWSVNIGEWSPSLRAAIDAAMGESQPVSSPSAEPNGVSVSQPESA